MINNHNRKINYKNKRERNRNKLLSNYGNKKEKENKKSLTNGR